jgi:hypothetical protein
LSSTTISGYVDTSAHWNPGSGNANPAAISFNGESKQDGFNVNVVNIVLEKPLDESTWSAGYKVDLLYGPNAVGFNNSINGDGTSDSGIKQAYVALRAPVGNGIDFKIGTFDTIIGYEVFNAGSNPNYTRSWGYTIEPTQHTGVLGSYQVNKVVGLSAGVANTWSAGINARPRRARVTAGGDDFTVQDESEKTWMGAITLTAPDDMGFLAGSALYLGVVDGFSTFAAEEVTSYYAGFTLATPIKGVKLGASYDYQDVYDGDVGPNQAVAVYASFQATEKLSLHLRGEYVDFADAIATGGRLNNNTQVDAAGDTIVSIGGIPDEAFALTATLQYDLWANVLSRLEVRWDHALEGEGPFGGSRPGWAGNGNGGGADEEDAIVVAANIIYKF